MTSVYTPTERQQFMRQWPKGAPKPKGYIDFFEWAEAQSGHGLRQKRCPDCQRYNFPQERDGSDKCGGGCAALGKRGRR